MILCARRMSRSREQSTRRRSRNKNMWMVCLFCSQNNNIVWLSNMADSCLRKWRGAQRFVGFFVIALFGCWLAEHADSDHVVQMLNKFSLSRLWIGEIHEDGDWPWTKELNGSFAWWRHLTTSTRILWGKLLYSVFFLLWRIARAWRKSALQRLQWNAFWFS